MTKEMKCDVIEAILESWNDSCNEEEEYMKATLDAIYAVISMANPQEAQP